jgi:hypothetical protein
MKRSMRIQGELAAARFEKLASYWVKRGDLARAAMARRTARLHRQTAELQRGSTETRSDPETP